MNRLIPILVLILAVGSATAQEWGDYGGAMGIFFSDTEFTSETANLMVDPGQPIFDMYIVMLDAQVDNVAGYECGIEITDPTVFILSGSGINGWTNFGGLLNHIVGYQTPVLVSGDGTVVLSTLSALYTGTDVVDIIMGPSTPSSAAPGNPYGLVWYGPIIGSDPDYLTVLYFCNLTSGAAGYPDVVARLNDIPLATESKSWTQVKNLFE